MREKREKICKILRAAHRKFSPPTDKEPGAGFKNCEPDHVITVAQRAAGNPPLDLH